MFFEIRSATDFDRGLMLYRFMVVNYMLGVAFCRYFVESSVPYNQSHGRFPVERLLIWTEDDICKGFIDGVPASKNKYFCMSRVRSFL